MTEIKNSHKNKFQLNYYFEWAQKALENSDYDQAKFFASKGLREAKKAGSDRSWILDFKNILNKFEGSHKINNSKDEINLTRIEGIGPKLQKRLKEQGIHSIKDLVKKTPVDLHRINGIGTQTAKKILSRAQNHLKSTKGNQAYFKIEGNQSPNVERRLDQKSTIYSNIHLEHNIAPKEGYSKDSNDSDSENKLIPNKMGSI